MRSGTSRREFFKKAGLAAGVGAAGAAALKKEYVKPLIKLLEPNSAYAQTPMIQAGSVTAPVSPHNIAATNALAVSFILVGSPDPLPGVAIDVINRFEIITDPLNLIAIALLVAGAAGPGTGEQSFRLVAVATSASDGNVILSVDAGTSPSPATLNIVPMDNPDGGTDTDTYPGTGLAALASQATPGASAMYTMDFFADSAVLGSVGLTMTTQ